MHQLPYIGTYWKKKSKSYNKTFKKSKRGWDLNGNKISRETSWYWSIPMHNGGLDFSQVLVHFLVLKLYLIQLQHNLVIVIIPFKEDLAQKRLYLPVVIYTLCKHWFCLLHVCPISGILSTAMENIFESKWHSLSFTISSSASFISLWFLGRVCMRYSLVKDWALSLAWE